MPILSVWQTEEVTSHVFGLSKWNVGSVQIVGYALVTLRSNERMSLVKRYDKLALMVRLTDAQHSSTIRIEGQLTLCTNSTTSFTCSSLYAFVLISIPFSATRLTSSCKVA